MANQRNLKAFVRYDGSGRVVAGSLILRKNKPKVGNFQEVKAYQCCNLGENPITVQVQSEFPFSYPDFVVESNDGVYRYIFNAGDNTTVNNVTELAAYNNSRYQGIGKFAAVGGDLIFTPNAAIAAMFAASGTTSISGYSFAD
jgi:hypothetical protein